MKSIEQTSPTSVMLRVKLLDSTSTTGAGKKTLAYNTSGLIISTIKAEEATSVVYTVAAGNVEDIATLGTYTAPTTDKCRFKEVDATNHPGLYELQFADARFATTKKLVITLSGATGLAEADFEIQMNKVDSQVKGIDTNAITDDSIHADAVTKLQNGLLKLSTAIGTVTVEYSLKCAIAMFNGDFVVDTLNKTVTFKDTEGATFSVISVPDNDTRTKVS